MHKQELFTFCKCNIWKCYVFRGLDPTSSLVADSSCRRVAGSLRESEGANGRVGRLEVNISVPGGHRQLPADIVAR